MPPKLPKTILLVEDNVSLCQHESRLLKKIGYTVITSHPSDEAIQVATQDDRVDLILMDTDLGDAMDTAQQILTSRDLPIVFLTSVAQASHRHVGSTYADHEPVEKDRKITPYGYIIKNSGEFVLKASIELAFELFENHQQTRQSEAHYRLLTDNSVDLIWLCGARANNYQMTYINPAVETLLGYRVDEYLALPIRQRITPGSFEILDQVIHEIERTGQPANFQLQLRHKSGHTIPGESWVKPIFDQHGHIINYQGRTGVACPALDEGRALAHEQTFTGPKHTAITTKTEFVDAAGHKVLVQSAHDMAKRKIIEDRQELLFRNLQALWQLASVKHRDVQFLTDHMLEELVEISASKFAFYGFINPDETHMRIYSWSKTAMEQCAVIDKPFDYVISEAGIWAEAVRTRQPIIVNDYSRDFPGKIGLPPGHVSITRIVSLPVFHEGRIVAVAAVANKEAEYSDEDVLILHGFLNNGQILLHQKKMEQSLRESEEKYKTIFNNAPVGIFRSTPEGRFIEVNPALARLLGYDTPQDVLDNIYNIAEQIYVQSNLREGIVSETEMSADVRHFENVYRRRDGELFTANLYLRSIKDAAGKTLYLEGLVEDITEKSRAEIALKKSEAELREANATKDRFLSIIAHDLRNPFFAFKSGFAALYKLLQGSGNKPVEEILNELQAYTDQLHTLLENLLKWSRLQRGKFPFNPALIDLKTSADYTIHFFKPAAAEKNITLISNIPANTIVYADYEMVHTILRNLISNAIKFTDNSGQVVTTARCDRNLVEISVSDNGIGMSPQKLDKLFRVGEKNITTSGTNGELGSGLGLILCREFVEKNGGKIWANSTPGLGSTFTFTLKRTT